MKKLLAIIMSLCLVIGVVSVSASAVSESDALRFDENGEFKILHISDFQDNYPAEEIMMAYINFMLDIYEPDLVVFGGDNSIGPEETKALEVEEIVKSIQKIILLPSKMVNNPYAQVHLWNILHFYNPMDRHQMYLRYFH